MKTRPGTPRLSDDALRDLLGLIKGAEARVRQVFFFDTPDLSLFEHGVVARARRTQSKPDDSVIKIRPVLPDEISRELRATEDFGVEVDAIPGGFVCSASYKRQMQAGKVKDSIAGRRSLRKLFSKEQRAFFGQHAPDGMELDNLSILGPINVLKLKFAPEGFARKLAVELWSYPSGSRILELSTKCAPGEAFEAAAEARAYLSERGVNLDGKQETKTRAALSYFSKALQTTIS